MVIAHLKIIFPFGHSCLCDANWQSVGWQHEQFAFCVLDVRDFVDVQPRCCGLDAVGPLFLGGRWVWVVPQNPGALLSIELG